MIGGTAPRTASARQDGRRHQPPRRSSAPSIRCGAGAIRAAFVRLRGVGLGKGAIRGMTPDDEIRPRALALEHFRVDGGGLARRLGSGFGWRDSSICMHWGLRHFERSRPSRPALSACHALVLRWGVFRPSFAPFPCVHLLGGQFAMRPSEAGDHQDAMHSGRQADSGPGKGATTAHHRGRQRIIQPAAGWNRRSHRDRRSDPDRSDASRVSLALRRPRPACPGR